MILSKLPLVAGASAGMSGPRSLAARPPVCFHPYPCDLLRSGATLASVQQRKSVPFNKPATSNVKIVPAGVCLGRDGHERTTDTSL